jgi:AcrR family transcriptional regulator
MARSAKTMRRAVGDAEKEQRRETILTAAKRVFARKGFHATTVADVAKAAKLSYGSVYWYFDSKDALFHALMESEEDALRAHIAESVAGSGLDLGVAGEAMFREAVRATFEFFERDRHSVRLLFRDSYALGDRFEKHLGGIYERFIHDIEASIAAAQRSGAIVDRHPPRLVAFSVAALIGQLALRRLTTDDDVPAGVLAEFVVDLVLEVLRPRS